MPHKHFEKMILFLMSLNFHFEKMCWKNKLTWQRACMVPNKSVHSGKLGCQKVSLMTIDLRPKSLRKYPFENESRQLWIPSNANPFRIDSLFNWISSDLNPFRHQSLQKMKPFRLESLQKRFPFLHESNQGIYDQILHFFVFLNDDKHKIDCLGLYVRTT